MGLLDISLPAGMRANLLLLQGTSAKIDRTQERLATGQRINSALDNPSNFFAARAAQNRASDLNIRKDGMLEAIKNGEAANAGLTAITSLIDSAKGLASAAHASNAKDRDSLSIQYNQVLTQLTSLAGDSSYRGTNLLKKDNLTIDFNENGSSNLTINGFDASATAIGLGKTVNSGYWNPVNTIADGYYAGLAVNNAGSAVAWDDTSFGQTTIPLAAQSGVISVAKGRNFSLALKNDGSVVAWGDNAAGQTNVPVAAQSGVVAIAAGTDSSFALKSDGTLIAWGNISTIPVAAQTGVVSISAGGAAAYALKSDGTVVGWGNVGATPPSGALTGVLSIKSDGGQTIALKIDGSVITWDNTTGNALPVPAILSSGVTDIATGPNQSVALKNDGSVIAWQTGTTATWPVPAAAGSGVVAIAMGNNSYNALALKSDGTVENWNVNPGSARTGTPGIKVSPPISWQLDSGITTSETQLEAATNMLRRNTAALSANLSVITIRQDFTQQMINTLQTGSDNLTLADMNEEGANMLMLQTRQNLGTTSLSLASQAAQSVMRLF